MAKTVAVTGATGTLGTACVQRFKMAKPRWVVYPTPPSLRLDVTCWLDVTDWLDGLSDRKLDAMVTCAGVSLVDASHNIRPSDWSYVIAVNLTGTWLAAVQAIKRGATRIVTIGSIHGCTPTSYLQRAAYTASKGGVKALTEALAVEYAPKGVVVNCVAPGHLPVLMDGTGAKRNLLTAAKRRTPTGQLATAEEVADVIFWLCNDAPLSLTGQTIVVDGGFTLNTWPM